MRISDKRIKQLQILLHDKFDLEFTAEQAQNVGLNIMRFVITKKQRQIDNTKDINDYMEMQQWLKKMKS